MNHKEYGEKKLRNTIIIYCLIGLVLIINSRALLKIDFPLRRGTCFSIIELNFKFFIVLLAGIALFYFYLGVRRYKVFILSMLVAICCGFNFFAIIYFTSIARTNKIFEISKVNNNVLILIIVLIISILNLRKNKYEFNPEKKNLIIYVATFVCVGVYIAIIQMSFLNSDLYKIIAKYQIQIKFIEASLCVAFVVVTYKQCIGEYESFFRYILGASFLLAFRQILVFIGEISGIHESLIGTVMFIIVFTMPVIGIFNEFLKKLNLAKFKINEVKNLEKKMREITDHMDDAVFAIDKDLKITYVTSSYCKIFGGVKESHIGRSPFVYIHNEYRGKVIQDIKEAIKKGENYKSEYKAINKDGEIIWVETLVNFMFKDGEVNGAVVNRRDVTARKKMENEIRVSEKKYRTFFNMCSDFTYIVEVEPKRKIVDVNQSMMEAFHMTVEGFKNSKIEDFLVRNKEEIYNKIMKKLRAGEQVIVKLPIRNKKNEMFDIEINYVPILEYDKLKMVLCLGKNLNIDKKIEELSIINKENEKRLLEAKAYDKLKTEFFANISHELKTPVNVIFSAIQLMEIKIGDENLKSYMASIKTNCYRLIRLIGNILDLSKLEAGFVEKKFMKEDIVQTVENLVHSVIPYAESRGLNITFDTNTEEFSMNMDKRHIERILINLLSNAIKFTKKGGHIFVDLNCLEDGVTIKVKDNGIGISKENQKLIFDRFRQVDKSFCRQNEGSGIGLSLVKSLIELYDGNIEVKSDLNCGSEFTVFLPLGKNEENISQMIDREIKQKFEEKISIELSDIY